MNHKKTLVLAMIALAGFVWSYGCRDDHAAGSESGGLLDSLARPQKGRSMRATSTMRVGELRRGPDGDRNAGERKYDPTADPRGDSDVQSNWDNFNVPPGGTHVLLDAQGPGVITHIWITFLGPDPARLGSSRARPTTRSSCSGCIGTGIRGRRWKRRSAISSPTASASAAKSSAFP